ncbi:hypothetical protein HKX48_003249 [Thoreauomyces humboldtii]|nr:hypothetical protein HKX48_003249 [Thoreauomyces humboldtii]
MASICSSQLRSILFPFLLALLLVTSAQGNQQHQLPLSTDADPIPCSSPKSVAIIGAGAAGTSFAYHLRQAIPASLLSITIYEASDRIGGRASHFEINGENVEIGASIFLKENENLYNATKRFGLNFTEGTLDDEPRWSIWSSQTNTFQFIASPDWKKNLARMVWRYGFWAPYHTAKLAKKAAVLFGIGARNVQMTTDVTPSLANIIKEFGLDDVYRQPARSYLGVKDLYLDEVVGAAVRVNYGQDLTAGLPASPALISMAAAGGETVAVEGGNERIFQAFAEAATDGILLSTPVVHISRLSSSLSKYVVVPKNAAGSIHDMVAIAVPNPERSIQLGGLAHSPTAHSYVHLHVTLVPATHLNPTYFTTPDGSSVPTTILTKAVDEGVDDPFNSISRVGNGTFKIFSRSIATDERLSEWFVDPDLDGVRRFEWDAYPKFSLDEQDPLAKDGDDAVVLDDGVFYLNAFEHVFSCMESQTAVGRRIAAFVADKLLKEMAGDAEKRWKEGLDGAACAA